MLSYWHLLEKKNGVWKSSANPESGNFGTLKRDGHSSTGNQKLFFSPSLGRGGGHDALSCGSPRLQPTKSPHPNPRPTPGPG